jgi:hypothetical protein
MRRRAAARNMLKIMQTSGDDMSEILKIFPIALTRISVTDPFLSVAIFCGIGMLASLLLLIFDQNLFSAWAYP